MITLNKQTGIPLQRRILVIDDDEGTRLSVTMYLESRGFEVSQAQNGRVGIDLFHQESADLVLVDLIMPEVGGFEVLASIKEKSPDTPIIVISGTDKIDNAIEALRLGAWDFVLKPIQDMSVLLHSVQKVLERDRLIRENQRYQEKLEFDIEERTKELKDANKSLYREIEVRRQAEQAYRAIFDSVTAAMFIVDMDGIVIETNRHATYQFGFNSTKLLGCHLKELIYPNDHSVFFRLLDEVKTNGHSQTELKGRRKDQSVIMNEVVGVDVFFKGRTQVLLVFMDITERKKMAEKERLHHQQLLQADKMASLGVLVSGVAHEITNPNNLIKMNTPLLKKIWGAMEPVLKEHCRSRGDYYVAPWIKCSEIQDKIPEIIRGIMEGSGRIDKFVKELKNFAVPASLDFRSDVRINDVVLSAVTLLSNLLCKSTNHFSVDYGDDLPLINGNPQHLEQVVINLLENSCHALQSKESKISITTKLDDDGGLIKVAVMDEGVGISPEIMPKIKDSFFTTKRESGGTGLGLSISSRIIEEHEGNLEFESVAGNGTVAIISLPVPLSNMTPNLGN